MIPSMVEETSPSQLGRSSYGAAGACQRCNWPEPPAPAEGAADRTASRRPARGATPAARPVLHLPNHHDQQEAPVSVAITAPTPPVAAPDSGLATRTIAE